MLPQLSPPAIGAIVLLVLVLIYLVHKHMQDSPKLKMSGFGYASCDGNYVWNGKLDKNKQYMVFDSSPHLAKGQVGGRQLYLRLDGQWLGCSAGDGVPDSFGSRGASEPPYGGDPQMTWQRLKLKYSPKLLESGKAAAAAAPAPAQ